ncbi:MAG: hypothetical protein HFF63_08985 [Oscillospiraceae bacterium]|nr:hypothetical protein [Oscillospiraceae bacterium]
MERETLIEIGRIISDGDEAVLEELTACAADPAAYFAAHEEQYRERAIDSPEEPDLIRWIGMVDILAARNFVCERDWKDEKEDFFCFFSNLAGIRRLQLETLSSGAGFWTKNGAPASAAPRPSALTATASCCFPARWRSWSG